MKSSNSSRSSRQSQQRDMGSRVPRGRYSDEDRRYSSDDGGYYSYRNLGPRRERESADSYRDYDESESGRRSEGQHYAPYRSSEQSYESNTRWDNDRFGESRWNRPGSDRNERSPRWDREDFGWGGQLSGRDQEMGYNSDMTDEDNYHDFEGISGGRSTRYADVDDVEGQYDEDYRDRDSYSRSRRGSSTSRSNYGSRR